MRIARRIVFAWLAVGLLGACQAGGITEFSSLARESGVLRDELILLTWNTRKLSDPDVAQDLSGMIDEHQPDLVFLQEVRIDQLQPDLMNGHFARSWSYPWPGGPTVGVLTLSDTPPLRVEPLQTEWREFFVTAPKVSLVTEHHLPDGQTLLAVNVHLLNFEAWDPFMLRAQLRDLERVMAAHAGPIVMAGDFNTWSEERLALVEDLARTLRLDEVTGFEGGRKTGDLNSAILHRTFGIHPDLPLDRVYSRGFTAVSARVLPADSSDHPPILVKLVRQADVDADLSQRPSDSD